MLYRLFLILTALTLGAQTPEKPLTAAERQTMLGHLQRTQELVIAATAGLTPAQAAFKPGPDRWSVAEVTEHIALTEGFLRGLIVGRIAKSPINAQLAARSADEIKAGDDKMLKQIVDRSQKAQAPEPAKPIGKFGSLEAAVAAFKEERAKTADYVKTTQDDLRDRGSAMGAGGSLSDGYQFLLLVAAHAERHTLQINEVKADPGFPK